MFMTSNFDGRITRFKTSFALKVQRKVFKERENSKKKCFSQLISFWSDFWQQKLGTLNVLVVLQRQMRNTIKSQY